MSLDYDMASIISKGKKRKKLGWIYSCYCVLTLACRKYYKGSLQLNQYRELDWNVDI